MHAPSSNSYSSGIFASLSCSSMLPPSYTYLDELGELMSTNRFCSTLKGFRRKMSLPLLVTAAHRSG